MNLFGVHIFSFLAGLAIGVFLFMAYRYRLQARFRPLITATYGPSAVALSFTAQLSHTIIELQLQQEMLRQQVEEWKQVVRQAPLGYIQVDEDNQLVWCNPQALILLKIQGYDPQQTRLLLELVRSYDLDSLIEHVRESQQPYQQDWTLYPVSVDLHHLPSPPICPLRGYAFPLSQQQVGVLLENRQEAFMLSEQRDRWTSDVAHELKTPLTSIRLVAETLQSRLEPPLRSWLDRLLQEVIRLSTLVQEILDLSQLESGATPALTLTSVDLPQLIQAAWQNLEPLIQSKRLHLDYQGPNYLVIQADATRLLRALINLLDNSLKYSPPGATIQIALTLAQPPQVQLDLIDSGCGFPETDLPFVFERFYRGDQSRARPPASTLPSISSRSSPAASPMKQPAADVDLDSAHAAQVFPAGSGSGLGLAIVKQIVERHQGQIRAQNHPETGGAWIQILLPQNPDVNPAD